MAAPTTNSDTHPLTHRCAICSKTNNLQRCTRCKVIFYCSREHQSTHFPTHKKACSVVARNYANYQREYVKLRDHNKQDLFLPARPFETCVGMFWMVFETRDYMRARYGYVDALQHMNTRESVDIQLENLRDMLRLCRGDNMGVRAIVPFLMLRTDRDQECYDFVKWWSTMGARSDYDWSDMEAPYLDVQGADVFEDSVAELTLDRRFMDLAQASALVLLKVKLLLDLRALQNATDVPPLNKMPSEIFDAVRAFVPRSPIIACNRALLEQRDNSALIHKLETQLEQLYEIIYKANPHFWHMLVHPELFLSERPYAYSKGSFEEAMLVLGYAYRAWEEVPGALEWNEDMYFEGDFADAA